MNLPDWVLKAIRDFAAPGTGKVTLTLECYQGGITKLELGGVVRVKPESAQIDTTGAKVTRT